MTNKIAVGNYLQTSSILKRIFKWHVSCICYVLVLLVPTVYRYANISYKNRTRKLLSIVPILITTKTIHTK